MGASTESEPLRWARVAGVAYLLVIVLGVLVEGLAASALVVEGDPSATAANIEQSPLLFRSAAFGVLVLYSSVLVLAFALYEVLKRVDRSLALLALLFRSAEGIVGATTVLLSLIVVQLVGDDAAAGLEPSDRSALAWAFLEARSAGMDIVLFLIGVGGTVYCYLLFVSRLVPRWLGGWGVLTYLSMLSLAAISFLVPDHPAWLEAVFYGSGTLFEVLIGLWLTFKGIDHDRWAQLPARPHG